MIYFDTYYDKSIGIQSKTRFQLLLDIFGWVKNRTEFISLHNASLLLWFDNEAIIINLDLTSSTSCLKKSLLHSS